MGFLKVNTKRKSPQPSSSSSAKRSRVSSPDPAASGTISKLTKPKPELTKMQIDEYRVLQQLSSGRRLAPIEKLSSDVLALIMAISGNIEFPQCSGVLAHKLKRTPYLETQMLRAQVQRHKMPVVPAMKWPFMTVQLLEKLQVFQFTGDSTQPFVPNIIESQLDSLECVKLIAYMIRRGCRIENSRAVYTALAKNGEWMAVEALASRNYRANTDVVILALRANQSSELAIQLFKLSQDNHSDWNQMWEVQQAAVAAGVPEITSYVNTG